MAKTLFQESLEYWIDKRGITKSEVGRRVGVQHATIARWLKGDTAAPANMLEPLADAFGITVQEFFAKP
jgi:transcriptional regulator with XRE-family HTH domain